MTAIQDKKFSVKFLLAEDVRAEANGKSSFMGVMAGERLVVAPAEALTRAVPPPAPGSPPRPAFVIPSLAFVFIVTGLEEDASGSKFTLLAPDRRTKLAEIESSIPVKKGVPAMFAVNARPFGGLVFGEYVAVLEVGQHEVEFPVLIEKAPVETEAVEKKKAPQKGKRARSPRVRPK